MARRRKSDALPKVEAFAKAPTTRKPGRFRMVVYPDGSERAVRCESAHGRCNGQALSDFFGVNPVMPVGKNMRSVESVLGELLSAMKVEVSEMAPELLAETWLRAAGPVLGSRSQLVSIVKGVATVRTPHPVVHRELVLMQRVLLPALNRELGDASVISSLKVIRG